MDAETLMSSYFETMAAGGDFAAFLAPDATWTNLDTGEVVAGADRVRDYVVALHSTLYAAHAQGSQLLVTAQHACLEGEFVADEGPARVPFCLVYDLGAREDGEGAITAMRLHTSFAALAPLARDHSARDHSGVAATNALA